MPIPKRKVGETPNAFMRRCVNNPTMREDYDTERQRYAVCMANIYDSDETFNDYPQAATENAKRALKFLKDSGNPNDCLTAVGFARANQLANREPVSLDTVKRMAAFIRHQQHKDVPYDEGCGKIGWDAWGGDAGIEWAIKKDKV